MGAVSRFEVGQPAMLTVLYSGKVSAVSGPTVTIEGHVIPTTLGPGVRTVSLGRLSSVCDRDHCDEGDCDAVSNVEPAFPRVDVEILLRAATTRHLDHHDGALRFCRDDLCRATSELAP